MIEKLIKRIVKNLDRGGIPYMIIGGQAVLLYGTPRLTRDIDITVGVDTDKFSLLETVCKQSQLKILSVNPETFAKTTKVLPAEEPKIRVRVDFIFSFTTYEKQAMKRVKNVLLEGYTVKFASCEDVIIHKLFAGRAIDEEDVRNILIKNRKKIDIKYIKKWLLKFSDIGGQEELLEKFNKLLRE